MLNVRSLAVSTPFYCQVLGLKEVARNAELQMVFLSFGVKDHDVVLRQVERTANGYDEYAVGLRQVAFHVGDGLSELRAFKAHLEACGIPIKRIHEHVAITSIYFSNPDNIELEAYIEHPAETWRGERQAARFSKPVRLD
ncbi:MAG: VOC family protein [Terriglobales bacterium]